MLSNDWRYICVYLFISSINILGLSRQSGYIWSYESDSFLAYLSYQVDLNQY